MPKSDDLQLLRGEGRFTADRLPDGVVHTAFVRSQHAYARITSIDVAEAQAMPGVVLVLTAADLEGILPLSPGFVPAGCELAPVMRPALCSDRVHHVGDLIAAVFAETEAEAIAAAEAVMVDLDPLPADEDRGFDGGPVAIRWRHGSDLETEAAFQNAAVSVSVAIRQSRVAPAPLEPRCMIAAPDGEGGLILFTPSQGASILRDDIAKLLGLPPRRVRLVTDDVGGSFGMKFGTYPEYIPIAVAAMRLSRPVCWISTRSEAFQSDTQGRGVDSHAELALDATGRFLGLRVAHTVDLGAYVSFASPHAATTGLGMARTGLYDIPASTVTVEGKLSNKPWTDAYRGAGKPEAILVIERLVDEAAVVMGLDRAELRRRNLIAAGNWPHRTAAGESFDSGDFLTCLDAAVAASHWASADRRAAEAQARGRLFGIGMACWLDVTSTGPIETANLRLAADTGWSMTIGSQDTGQGHLAGFRAIVDRGLDLRMGEVRLDQGDTDTVQAGGGTFGAKTMAVAGSAMAEAAQDLLRSARARAADLFDVDAAVLSYESGFFFLPGSNQRVGLTELAHTGDLVGQGQGGGKATFPNGCHVCEVEIDPDTGLLAVTGYTAVDDFGTVLDRPTLEGQIRGGIAQGLGQAFLEAVRFDEEGQLLSGSFMDYAMPRATDMPAIRLHLIESQPCATNPHGAKGSGQAGTIGALAAGMNAVADALRRAGARPIDPPTTPYAIWQALNGDA